MRFRLPIIEQIRTVPEWGGEVNNQGYLIELTEQQTDTPPRQCHTKDNVTIEANASVYWRIVDPVKALYEVDILPRSVADVALNALRANIGTLDLDEVLSERQQLNDRIAAQLSKVAQKWGLQFTRVEIQELRTTDETANIMRQQMEGERHRRAMVSVAAGEAEAKLTIAKAERDAAILRAEGQAKALETVATAEITYLKKLGEAMDSSAAARVLIAQKVLDGFDVITKNPAHKVFLPNSMNGLFTIPTDMNIPDDSPPL